MSNKSLSARIPAYKMVFASGELQRTYKDLVSIVQSLRAEFSKQYKGQFTVANVLHGYIDFTYFYLQNDYLKKHKLKLAVVLNHQEVQFELWLLGQTKDVQIDYWTKLQGVRWVDQDVMPEWSIFEILMLADPDFDNVKALSERIHGVFAELSEEIFATLKAYQQHT
ncbi:hypothetical protein CBQ28_23430 [Pseudoalteromonas sp. GCY]|uniref:DUF7000 family protein n=1 Tax=Pseudoalteromonas sp. GCY TaxID=2003316 RepID=UPI000BFED63C|nr:hypothetical protein [Pseudoalteromonas sp. GCY]PHI34691.1 hypothetical protein CBQ28_23430 [Pseudoalteromonas sp. GCY]QQQ64641.1 hypothetical protein JJQ94_03210 [Pseudoalteromonas sp. GCY]